MEFPVNIDLEPCPFCEDRSGTWIQVYETPVKNGKKEYLARIKCKFCDLCIDINKFCETKEEAICNAQDWWNGHLKYLTK